MTDLTAMIADLKAGDTDTVLAGTKYDDKNTYYHEAVKKIQVQDAKANAARVIVLEAALREMAKLLARSRTVIVEAEDMLEDQCGESLDSENAQGIHVLIDKALTATADLIEGGE